MKVTFYSNFLNHHQLPFCLEMCRLTNNNFVFVATEKTPHEQLKLGYADMNCLYPFVLTTYTSKENQEKAMMLALESDVIITGSAPEVYTKKRIEQGKLTFRYSERLFKKGYFVFFHPKSLLNLWKNHFRYRKDPLFMLCASTYTAHDYGIGKSYKGKTYKWGYFPEVKKHSLDNLMGRKSRSKKPKILWVGRLIGLKHPEAAINLAEFLRNSGYHSEIDIIGNGVLEDQLKTMVAEKRLNDYVHFLGSLPFEEVREHMESADIFIFTSDYNEGWGAVLNEAMNSGCAVIASHAIGSVGFLLKNGNNGLIYKNGNQKHLNSLVKGLLDNPANIELLGRNAYKSMINEWNAKTAAERFINLVKSILADEETPYNSGPCSRAVPVSNLSAYRKLTKINE